MARYVDERYILSGRERGSGVTQVDGQPAAPFFLPTVRLHAGEGADQGAFTGIDVPGGGYDVHSSAHPPSVRGLEGCQHFPYR